MNTGLPPLAWHHTSPPVVQSVEPLGEGDFCICYVVNRTHIIRLAKHAEASASLRRETLLLPYLEQRLDVDIPHIEGVGTRLDTGEQFIFYPLVAGTILGPEALSSLDMTCRSELVRQMAGFATRLHGLPVETARSCGLKEIDPQRYLPELMRRASPRLSRRVDADAWQYYRRLVELYFDTPELHIYTPSLLHGDLSPWHFLADLKHCVLTGVIDFGDCFIGDPHWDLIYLLEDYGKDTLDLFLSFYAPDTKLQASKRVQMFQQLNNVEYCMSKLSEGDQAAIEEAIDTLITQAATQAVV
jgi:aminoglycoside 2''-phosphotransferase